MPPKRSRSKSRPKIRKKQLNHYDLIQFKKMLGKKLVQVKPTMSPAKLTEYKKFILDKTVREIKLNGTVLDGILIIEDELAAVIQSLSYNEITKNNIDLDIIVQQS